MAIFYFVIRNKRDHNGMTSTAFLSPAPPTVTSLNFDPVGVVLTCISTGSPATIVTWMREGEELTIDGTVYTATQTVTNRRESTYENVLTSNVMKFTAGVYSCRVENALGISEPMSLKIVGKFTGDAFIGNKFCQDLVSAL